MSQASPLGLRAGAQGSPVWFSAREVLVGVFPRLRPPAVKWGSQQFLTKNESIEK